MKLKCALIIIPLAALSISHAFSQTLLTEAHLAQSGGTAEITNAVNLAIGIGSPPARLFDDLWVQAGDAGHTYVIGPGDDTDFAAFVSQLTDGVASDLSYVLAIGNSSGGQSPFSEVEFFNGLPPGNNGIDLAGFQIAYFSLRFDPLVIASPGNDPNSDGKWTDYSFSAVFSVYGQSVPEPSPLGLLFLGVVALYAKARWLTRSLPSTPR